MQQYLDMLRNKEYTALAALQSVGLASVINAIRNKYPLLAGELLMDLEVNHARMACDFTIQENEAIEKAIEECWKKIELLRDELKESRLLKRLPDTGKHSVEDGVMPEPNVQLIIDCAEDVGGAAAYGIDGKWYWTFDWEIKEECKFTVTHWRYL